MFFRFPCPKCREPIGIRSKGDCPDCGYHPMRHERSRALRFAEVKMATSSFVVGLMVYAVHYR